MRTLRSQVRWIMITIVVLFVISIFGMYGFEGARRGRPDRGEGGDYVVAEIDGKALMRSSLDQSVRNLVSRMDVRDVKPEDIPRLYQAALDSLATNQRLAIEAESSGLKATDEEIEAAVREVSDQFPTKEAFMQYLDQSGIKMAEFRSNLADQIVQGKMVERASAGIEATDEEALDFYDKMKTLFFHTPAGFKVDFARVKGEEAAGRIAEAARAGGEWKAAVESVSSADVQSSSTETGPVFMTESSFKDQYAPIALLDIGVVGGPFPLTSDDFFVAVKREKVEESTVSFDEVSADVKHFVLEDKRRAALDAFFKDLRARASVVVHDAELFHVPEAPVVSSDEPESQDAPAEAEGEAK